jgi:hypothetical protein
MSDHGQGMGSTHALLCCVLLTDVKLVGPWTVWQGPPPRYVYLHFFMCRSCT